MKKIQIARRHTDCEQRTQCWTSASPAQETICRKDDEMEQAAASSIR